MQMDIGLDTGAVLMERAIAIAPDDTTATLFEKLTPLAATTIVEALATLPTLLERPQATAGATYARKIEKSEGRIDWNQPAATIERRIRAFDPFPGCETHFGTEAVKIWRAQVVDGAAPVTPGIVIEANESYITVQCGEQQLRLLMVQKAGSKRMSTGEFLHGKSISIGTKLL